MQHQQSNTRQNFAVLKVQCKSSVYILHCELSAENNTLTKVLPQSEIRPKEIRQQEKMTDNCIYPH